MKRLNEGEGNGEKMDEEWFIICLFLINYVWILKINFNKIIWAHKKIKDFYYVLFIIIKDLCKIRKSQNLSHNLPINFWTMSLMDSNKLPSSRKSWQPMALTFTCLEQLEFLAAIHSQSSSTKCNTEVALDLSTQSSKALRTLPINSMSWLTVMTELAEPAPSQKKNQERDSKLTTKSQWASIKSQEKLYGQSATKSSIRPNTTK